MVQQSMMLGGWKGEISRLIYDSIEFFRFSFGKIFKFLEKFVFFSTNTGMNYAPVSIWK